jgi:pimeloyl-ACP methyl ester carboxylesterase
MGGADNTPRAGSVKANGLEFGMLETGSGPLALCLHGFPDSAHGYRHLLPALAEAGFHAVAPFTRGYAPTALAEDGDYGMGALIADAVALHEALDGDGEAVLIGHDWGAATAYGAASFAPERWRRVVAMAVPPWALNARMFGDYDQLRRFFYFFFFGTALAEPVVAAGDLAFLERAWRDWSPGYDPSEDLAHARDAIGDPANLSAAISYYRGVLTSLDGSPPPSHAAEAAALQTIGPQPTLYLHGQRDGCIGVDLVADVADHLSPGSRMEVVEGAGHFLHLEKPAEVNEHILGFLTAPSSS